MIYIYIYMCIYVYIYTHVLWIISPKTKWNHGENPLSSPLTHRCVKTLVAPVTWLWHLYDLWHRPVTLCVSFCSSHSSHAMDFFRDLTWKILEICIRIIWASQYISVSNSASVGCVLMYRVWLVQLRVTSVTTPNAA